MEDKGDWELSGVRTYKNWPMIFLSSHFPFHKDQKLVFQKLWRLLMPTSGWKHMTLQWALHQFKIKFCIKKLEILIFLQDDLGFPAGPMVKNTPANARFQVWSLGWEDPLEEQMINLLQCSCLGNPTDRGAWQAWDHKRHGNYWATKQHQDNQTHSPDIHPCVLNS